MVTTKAGSKLIYRDIDVIKPMGDKFTLLLGLSNLEQLKRKDSYSMMSNIQTANELHRMGIKVWAFITPILPGITNVDEMINALDKNIPVLLDRIRIGKNNRPSLEKYIGKNYPHLTSTYNDILNNNIDVYFDQIREKWSNDQRVQFVFE
jgi:DNA repair photolyase